MQRNFTLAVLAIGTSAWKANDYATHQYNFDEYKPIEQVQLEDQELPLSYQPALTESTEIETVTDQVLWSKLSEINGIERYTHAHHGDDASDAHPTADHEYPEEHAHYRETTYNQRVPIIVNQERKVYHVIPTRYTRSYDEEEEEEPEYAEDILFPTRKADTLHSDRFKKAYSRYQEPLYDVTVHDFAEAECMFNECF